MEAAIIDAHAHLRQGKFDPAILAAGDKLGVEYFLCSNIGRFKPHPTHDEVREMNADLAGQLDRYPDRLRGYSYINPRYGRLAMDDLRRNVEERGMIGIKLWISTLADDEALDPFMDYAAAHNLIVLAHAWRKTEPEFPYESTATNIAAIAARHPAARIIMAHLGGQAESALNTIRPFPNVAADTSGTIIGHGEVKLAVDRLGSKRVVFGSDIPNIDLAVNIGKVLGAELSPAQQDRIFGGNIRDWLGSITA